MEKKAPVVACPTCAGASVFAPTNPWRPFCSDRCRQIDFGAWASEEFRVPVKPELQGDESEDPPEQMLH